MPAGETTFSESIAEFTARLDRLDPPRRFALAVSGGRDSMALARLAAEYGNAKGATIFAYSVDHGLRPEASAEAKQAVAWCQALGLEARVLQWIGDKPQSALQEQARAARYRLLAAAANEDQCGAVLTAHSLDDLAETFFMRLRRGSGADGLAAMAEAQWIAAGPGGLVRLLRPLLGFSRTSLTQIVAGAGQDYVDDPSNDDPAFERVRVRALLGALTEQDLLTHEALNLTAQRLRTSVRQQQQAEEDLFEKAGGCFYAWGGVSLDRLPDDPSLAGLAARLIHAVAGEAHKPETDAARAALFDARKTGAATLGGALIKAVKGKVWFLREPAAVLGRSGKPALAAMALRGPVLWDGRFILDPADGCAEDLQIAPLGPDTAASSRFDQGPIEAVSAMPGIYQRNALIGAPGLPFMRSGGVRISALSSERFKGGIIRF